MRIYHRPIWIVVFGLQIVASDFLSSAVVKPAVAELRSLPTSSAVVQYPDGKKTEDAGLARDNSSAAPVISRLKGARFAFNFKQPISLNGLAIPRLGYGDWAVPSNVTLWIDGKNFGSFDLSAPIIKPGSNWDQAVDVIEFEKTTSARSIEILVNAVDVTGRNQHGTFRLLGAERPPVRIDLNVAGEVPADSYGVELKVESSLPVETPFFDVSLYQFREVRTVETQLAPLPQGSSTVKVLWSDLDLNFSLPTAATPLNLSSLTLRDPSKRSQIKLISWKYLTDPLRRLSPAWENVPDRQWKADSEGWRPGVPREGFGRFGWNQQSGLLVGSVLPNGFGGRAVDSAGKAFAADWRIHLGEARDVRWQRTQVDWTSVEHGAYYDYTLEAKNELAAKAPELLQEKRGPQRIIGSILAPGFLVDSQETTATIELVGTPAWATESQPASIRFPTSAGIKTVRENEDLKGDLLSEGWFVVEWKGMEKLPVLILPKKRPKTVRISGKNLVLSYDGPLERIGISFPFGYRVPDPEARLNIGEVVRQLGEIMRAFPVTSTQRFREKGSAPVIEVEESISHIVWTNDWAERGRPVAPISPLLVFAQKEGYPVVTPKDLRELNWPTKYGPYSYIEGSGASYELPIPPLTTTFYLRPSQLSEAAAKVARDIAAAGAPPTDWLNQDTLNSWYMWASGSLAYSLLDESQKARFSEHWKARLDHALRPNLWFARKEPFSGIEYPISFGWIERSSDTIGDVNSGIGATLYALWAYARCTGDWKFVEERWPIIKKTLEYFVVEHDWAQMQTGAREHSASSAIDMDGIGYEGALAFANMAAVLKQEDDAAFGRLLVARLAVPTCMRWIGIKWLKSGLSDADRSGWKGVGVGLSEVTGFDVLHKGEGGPNHQNSELALSLSWVGQFPELYTLHLWGLGTPFWQWFEYDYVEKQIEDWRKQYDGTRNNHPANIIAHLYLRRLLGEPRASLDQELEKQAYWAKSPEPLVSRENAAFYSMLLASHIPVTLKSWGSAGVLDAEYDEDKKVARLEFHSAEPFVLEMELSEKVKEIKVGSDTVKSGENAGAISINVPAGTNAVTLEF